MRLFAADTSSATASAAVFEDGRLIFEASLNNGLTHSQSFMPLCESVFEFSGFSPSSIDYFACTAGPGSFTGIRIGVETIKALAHFNNARCIAVSTLEALCAGRQGRSAAIMDARCDQVYCAAFEGQKRLIEDSAMAIEELIAVLKELGGSFEFIGDGVAVHGEALQSALGANAMLTPQYMNMVRASSVGYVAHKLLEQGLDTDYKGLNPRYLRKPQAVREYERRNSGL